MKFCKNLQRVVDISDPEWAPYWTNYKMMKKLIKELPTLVPADAARESSDEESPSNQNRKPPAPKSNETMGQFPGERAFFKVLNAELRKAVHFFDKAVQEFTIREERVREGILIMKKPGYVMVSDRWSSLAKSLYKLYKDLLLLETYAIMTYCSFSKILKKHDKMTGYNTRANFMTKYVNNANFTHYPSVLRMIKRCEEFYSDVAANLAREGKEGLYEDERLFINMIQNLNKQVMGTAAAEGAPGSDSGGEQSVESDSSRSNADSIKSATKALSRGPSVASVSHGSIGESAQTTELRSIIESTTAANIASTTTTVADDALTMDRLSKRLKTE
eukprot:CAMPEP_0196817152 /NCGR_PEP_ID=MMETSP1362-20130617/59040_1 /TAXON_ID=163516 /ORGANISM="Leptocylindrus danicus, Strain CCMP1856" /LENGTH=331 /DNA_ID=CAMNT_0042194731 /DNA_START=29 /DNA_END=1024 /DNA_ORIENTATION=+